MNLEFYKKKLIESNNYTKEVENAFSSNNKEKIYRDLKNINKSEINFILELIAEDLIINRVSKIERSGMKLGLHRIKNILKILGNPEKKLKVIHIAGTNGKGSVASYINSILKKRYRVGMYVSPSMESFNDRIRIDDKYISFVEMYDTYNKILDIWNKNFKSEDDRITVFEILTIIAILYFEKNKVDFAIMEVGLGGRFDATNIFSEKCISIISKIALDHTKILGDTIEKIAYEKAGIIIENDCVIVQDNKKSVIDVIKKVADEKNASLKIINLNDIRLEEINEKYNKFSYKNIRNIKIKMLGEYQIYNASLALEAILTLRDKNIIYLTDLEIKEGLEETFWLGRLEWIKTNILIDGAHNLDGIESLVKYIKKSKLRNLKILVGILEDKNYEKMIEKLSSINAEFFVVNVPIQIKKTNLEKLAKSFKKPVKKYDDYKTALEDLLPKLKEQETFIISGSLYLISEVRKYILEK